MSQELFSRPAGKPWLPSNAQEAERSAGAPESVLPLSERGRMPLTKDKYLVKEDPELIRWERIVREFLRNLSPLHRHRISDTVRTNCIRVFISNGYPQFEVR